MKHSKREFRVETMRGTGNGGQHRNKTDSAVRITHLPTGTTSYADERSQKHSKRSAWAEMDRRLADLKRDKLAGARKAKRDAAIQPQAAIRTYDYKLGLAIDHRSGKKAPLKRVLGKGEIELLHP